MEPMAFATLAFYVSAALLSLNRMRSYNGKQLTSLLFFVLLGIVIFFGEGLSVQYMAMLAVGILIFNCVLGSDSPSHRLFYLAIGTLYVLANILSYTNFLLQSVLFGIMSSVIYKESTRTGFVEKQKEEKRDVLHFFVGILLISIFFAFRESTASLILMLLVIFTIYAIVLSEVYKKSAFSMFVYSFERRGSILGHGAVWLALGSMLVASFLSGPFVIATLIAIFIGDPIATFVGLRLKGPRLPYNRKKSVSGSLAYFATTLALSYPFIGAYSLPLSLIAAFSEGLDVRMDDNFTVAFILVVIILIARHTGLAY
ncbi:MAG: hypothetical protein KGI00_00880 [Candidatus Micrarchaeota archaeon]|nr:hypothetical protein [Candidatus Micrarchaeota archaeon]MDE1824525.1 hypothetical protein [Candidatus Micrarchaeota archaeon]MDE1849263.1 hypothetical protein [Candidatus Micrarchaeota archaeon]